MPESLSIGSTASRAGVSASALRYYEREGLIHGPRTAGGQRRYPREVIRRISFVRVAQQVGLTIDEIRAALDSLPTDRTPSREDWRRLEAAWRPRLDEQIAALERLRDRFDGCIGCGCLSLDVCARYNPEDVAARHGSGARWLLGESPPTGSA